MNKLFLIVAIVIACVFAALGQSNLPTLYRQPTISRSDIVFSYAGDLWTVSRTGGDAKRLTSGVGVETSPYFSPDGSLIAFTADYDGNTDVYVVPAVGGIPRRVTYHPSVNSQTD